MSFLDSLIPVAVGHRTEITIAATAFANLFCAFVPKAAPAVATLTAVAPFAAAAFAAARASRK